MKLKNKTRSILIVCATLVFLLWAVYMFLLSEYSLKNLWLPMAADSMKAELKVDSCSASLFCATTFEAKGVSLKTANLSVSMKEIALEAHPIAFLFGSPLRVDTLTVDGLNVAADASKAQKSAETKPQNSGKAKEKEDAPVELPVQIGVVTVKNSTLSWKDSADHTVLVKDAEFSFKDLFPGAAASLTTGGKLSITFGETAVENTAANLTLKFTVPETMRLPDTFSVNIGCGRAPVRAGTFTAQDVSLAMIADCKIKDGAYLIESGSLSIGSEKGGDMLDLKLTGSLKSTLRDGEVDGNLKIFQSGLADALVSSWTKTKITGLSAESSFSGSIQNGNLQSTAQLKITAAKLTVPAKNGEAAFENPVLNLGAGLSGNIDTRNFTLEHGLLHILCGGTELASATLGEPWAFISKGKFQLYPFPKAIAQANNFPMNLLTPFVGGSWKDETVKLHAESFASSLKVQFGTSFPVGSESFAGPLDATFHISGSDGVFNVSESSFTIHGNDTAVAAEISGMYETKRNAFQAAAKWHIKNPAKVFGNTALEAYPEIDPVFNVSGTAAPADQSVTLWASLSGGRYALNLNGTFAQDEQVYRFNGVKAAFQMDGLNRAELNVSGEVPKNGDLKKADLKVSAEKAIRADGLDLKIPEIFQRSSILFNAEIKGETTTGTFKADSAWKDQPLHAEGSWNAAFPDKKLERAEVDAKLSQNGKTFADLAISGIFPQLTVKSKGIDLKKLQMILGFEKKPETVEQPKKKSGIITGATSKKTAPAAAANSAEPGALDLSAVDGMTLDVQLQNLAYTQDLVASLNGKITVKNNVIRLSAGEIVLNQAAGTCGLALDTGKEGGWPFDFNGTIANLELEPVARALRDGEDPGFGGKIKKMSVILSGRGFMPENLMKHSNGGTVFSLEDIHMSMEVKSHDALISMLQLPVQLLPNLADAIEKFEQTKIGQGLSSGITKLKPILNGETDLTFKKGSGKVSIRNGVLDVGSITLEDGPIQKETLKGTLVLPDGELDMESEMTLGDFAIPLEVQGTLANPKPDWKETIQKLFGNTVRTLLNSPEKIQDAVENVQEVIDLFRKK